MWVWRTLGCDHVELPREALVALGRRARGSGGNCLSMGSSGQLSQAEATQEPFYKDSRGDSLQLCPEASQTHAPAAWRLAPVKKLQFCVPGAVVVAEGGSPTTTDSSGTVLPLLEALRRAVEDGFGSITFTAPMVDVKLRDDLAVEAVATPADPRWPLVVVGTQIGASIRLSIVNELSVTGGSTMLPSIFSGTEQARPAPVTCHDFKLLFVQKGGPALDPSRLHACTVEAVAKELERWANKALSSRPQSWVPLHLLTKAASVEQPLRGPSPVPSSHALFSRAGRELGDFVIASAAEMEIQIEPFELSYGEEHCAALRKMIGEEISNVLGIPSEQVMCGDFTLTGLCPQKRHVRRESVTLSIAVLHPEVNNLLHERSLPLYKPTIPLAFKPNPLGFSQSFDELGGSTLRSSASVPTLKLTDKTVVKDGPSLQAAMKRAATEQALAALKDAEAMMMTLTQMVGSPKRGRGTTAWQSTSTTRPKLGKALHNVSQSFDLPPDQLMKKFVKCLASSKHPLRKHPDVFPMLSRVQPQGVRICAPLVTSEDIVGADLKEGLKPMVKARKAKKSDAEPVDIECLSKLSTMRSEILKIYSDPDGEILAEKQRLMNFSAKELMETMEASISKEPTLMVVLEVILEKVSADVDFCLRLRLHHGVSRLDYIIMRFNSQREFVYRCLLIFQNLIEKDQGVVDSIIEQKLAPHFITSMSAFVRDQPMQLVGCQILKRLYLRARETAQQGVRVIVLGKGLPEVITFQGLERIVTAMQLFENDATIQLDGCITLSSLGELLTNSGMAKNIFDILEVVMRRHASRADILSYGILTIGRLGPSFLAHDPRGVKSIVEAMERHRSNNALQRVGTRALFALSKAEHALQASRAGGSVSALTMAMVAHCKDAQVLQEGARALERHCPRGLAALSAICGGMQSALPVLTWLSGPVDNMNAAMDVKFDFTQMEDTDWDAGMVENFLKDIADSPEEDNGHQALQTNLATPYGFRRRGLRDMLDAADAKWANPGALKVRSMNSKLSVRANLLLHDIEQLEKEGCDPGVLRGTGPTEEQLHRLCEVLDGGLRVKQYSAQDGEFLALLLAHFAWHSAVHAQEIIAANGHSALFAWLTATRFTRDPTDQLQAFPMHRACLAGLSCLCRHGEEAVNRILELKIGVEPEQLTVTQVVVQLAGHSLAENVRCAAFRCLARIIPHIGKRASEFNLNTPELWSCLLEELRNPDEVLRTAAAACVLEAILDRWLDAKETPAERAEDLAKGLMTALHKATESSNASAALPVLLAVVQLSLTTGGSEVSAAAALHGQEGLVPVLVEWLPKGSTPSAGPVARAAATAAATTLRALAERNAALGAAELSALLRHGTVASSEAAFREACEGALTHAVQRETDAVLLVKLMVTRLVHSAPPNNEMVVQFEVLIQMMARAVQLLKQAPDQATEALAAALEGAKPLVPQGKGKGADKLLQKIAEVQAIIRGPDPGTTLTATKLGLGATGAGTTLGASAQPGSR